MCEVSLDPVRQQANGSGKRPGNGMGFIEVLNELLSSEFRIRQSVRGQSDSLRLYHLCIILGGYVARVSRRGDEHLGSRLVEEKSYAEY